MQIRPQYHFRQTDTGLDAWDVRRLIKLSDGFVVRQIDPGTLPELDQNHWYQHPTDVPTPRSLLQHMQLIEACDIEFPIILDANGRVMDGMHRVCKAVKQGITRLPAVQFEVDPHPDFKNCDPRELPYDDAHPRTS